MVFQGGGARFAFLLAVPVQLRMHVILSRYWYSGEAPEQASLLSDQQLC